MQTFQSKRPRVNILLLPAREGWQAKAYRSDVAGVAVYETTGYFDKQSAYNDAQGWALKNHYVIGKISGMSDPQKPRTRRAYSKSWPVT